jgi:hypothetical protein
MKPNFRMSSLSHSIALKSAHNCSFKGHKSFQELINLTIYPLDIAEWTASAQTSPHIPTKLAAPLFITTSKSASNGLSRY